MKLHLYKDGFMPNYMVWIDHGEKMPHVDNHHMGVLSSGVDVA